MRTKLIMWEKLNKYKAKHIAKKLGISESTYSLIKSGKSNPTIDLLYRFDAIYGPDIDVLDLFRKEDNEKTR